MIALLFLITLLLYILVGWVTVRFVGKYTGTRIVKYLTIAVFVLVPTWDIIPGKFYFQHLCDREAGTRVINTMEVDPDYFMPDGQPDEKKLRQVVSQPNKTDKDFSSLFSITKFESGIEDIQTSVVLGRAISFSYYGGWINGYLFPQGPPITCPRYHSSHGQIWREVIKPKKNTHEGGN